MRIIGGTLKGRRLVTPKGLSLRPTSDRVKESLFNILGDEIRGKVVLDLFAGTGNLGIEGLSRGAARAFFVEKDQGALRILRRNLSLCGMEDRSEIVRKDVLEAIFGLKGRGACFDLIFMDPPYERGLIEKTLLHLLHHRIYHEESLLVIEHNRREPLGDLSDSWKRIRQRKTGDTVISFLSPLIPSFSPEIGKELE